MVNFTALLKAANKAAKRPKLPPEDQLLSRKDFGKYCWIRNIGYCVFCQEQAVNAHHILDRKLYPDGGYYLGNGAAVCERHHILCETTHISVEATRLAARIEKPVLPPGFDPHKVYDKWGNIVINDGVILMGPLAKDTGCQRALTAGQKAWKLYDKVPFMADQVLELPGATSTGLA